MLISTPPPRMLETTISEVQPGTVWPDNKATTARMASSIPSSPELIWNVVDRDTPLLRAAILCLLGGAP